MIVLGSLTLFASEGGPVTVEILADDYPTRFPFLGEPKPNRLIGTLFGEQAYGQLIWTGFPASDAVLDIEVVTQGNKAARFQWSSDDGETFEPENTGILVPLGGSVALGSSGFFASFGASPPPEYETEYTFEESGDADKSGTGPDVSISGSGSIDGVIQIQTGVGSIRYRLNAGNWSDPVSMADLPITLPGVLVELDVAPENELGLLLEFGTVFSSRIRGFFTMRLTRGDVVETYERMVVGQPLWFVASSVPLAKRSRLLSGASWSGIDRSPVGSYVLE